MVMSSYLAIVARILILDQMVFIQVLQELNIPTPLDSILDIWIKKMPLIGHPDKRKLLGLALASLLTVQNDSIYQRFDVLLQCICETLNDIMVQDKDDPAIFVEWVRSDISLITADLGVISHFCFISLTLGMQLVDSHRGHTDRWRWSMENGTDCVQYTSLWSLPWALPKRSRAHNCAERLLWISGNTRTYESLTVKVK